MPGITGIEVGRQIGRKYPDIWIVVMTGADPSTVQIAPGWGLIAKPFAPKALLDEIALVSENGRVGLGSFRRDLNTTRREVA